MTNRYLASRFVAVALVGILGGLYIQSNYAMWGRVGRDAFIAYEMSRFDRYMATVPPIAHTLFGATLLAVGFAVIYELIALGMSAILKTKSLTGGSS
jgi:hypothetical protein